MKHQIIQLRAQLDGNAARLAGLDHVAVLARGYSLTMNSAGEILRDAAAVAVGERIVTTLAAGRLESEVKSKS
jgi:exodeoxyribonuclease VII large subunit